MSTIFNFLQTKNNRGIFWWIRFYYEEFLNSIYQRKVSNKIDNNWKGVRIQSSYYPSLYPKKNKNNVFLYLELQNQHKIWKRN